MKKPIIKRSIIFVIVLVILLTMSPTIGLAQKNDIENHWAKDVIDKWLGLGLATGYQDNSFRPENPITRAEFMALTNRAFGFTDEATIQISDVKDSDWYAKTVKQAISAGYIGGYPDGSIRPDNPIARQEAAVIIKSIMNLTVNAIATDNFNDGAEIPTWSKGHVGAVVQAGYMRGYPDGSFKPRAPITRAEALVVLDKAMMEKHDIQDKKTIIDKAGIYGSTTGTEIIDGDVVITAEGVTLQNMIIKGDLTIDEKVGNGDVTLKNVVVKGNTFVNGGGENSIYFIDVTTGKVYVLRSDGPVRIVASGTSDIQELIAGSDVKLEEVNLAGGGFGGIVVEKNVAGNIDITLVGVKCDTIDIKAEGVKLNVDNTSTVAKLTVDAPNTEITGSGKIDSAVVNVNGVSFQNRPTTITTASGVETPTVINVPTPGGGGGGGGGAPNASQSAPTGLVGVAPTSALDDGKITGTTAAMEYKLSTDANWTAVTETEITGLVAGTYHVRYAAKEGFNAGATASVVVPAYEPAIEAGAPATFEFEIRPGSIEFEVANIKDIDGISVDLDKLFLYPNSLVEFIRITDQGVVATFNFSYLGIDEDQLQSGLGFEDIYEYWMGLAFIEEFDQIESFQVTLLGTYDEIPFEEIKIEGLQFADRAGIASYISDSLIDTLENLLVQSRNLKISVGIGTNPGEAPQTAHDDLDFAINEATVLEGSGGTIKQLFDAVEMLSSVMTEFEKSIVPAPVPTVPSAEHSDAWLIADNEDGTALIGVNVRDDEHNPIEAYTAAGFAVHATGTTDDVGVIEDVEYLHRSTYNLILRHDDGTYNVDVKVDGILVEQNLEVTISTSPGVPNQDQSAPTLLTGVAPTSELNNDGKITGTTAAMEYKLSTDGSWTPATETEITGLVAGTYHVRYAAKEGFNAGATAEVEVPAYVAPNQDQAAPEGLAGVAPTSALNDGKITGTTDEMEYKLSTDGSWIAVTGTEITGLVAGTYHVRYAAREGFNAGTSAEVEVPAYVAPLPAVGDLLNAVAGSDFTGVIYSKAGSIYYNRVDTSGIWGIETLLGTGTEGRLAIDSTGKPHAVYTTTGKIGYRWYDGSAWSDEILIGSQNHGGVGSCSKPDIDVDGDGVAHITYTDSHGSSGDDYTHSDIMYAHNRTGAFTTILIYRGYRDFSSSGSWAADYYNKGSYITVKENGDYFILAHNHNIWRWPAGTDNTYSIVVKSNLGEGAKSNYGSDIFDIYDLTSNGNKIVALYRETGFKASELTVSGATINFTNTQDITGTAVNSVETDGINVVVGGISNTNLQTHYNGTSQAHGGITLKVGTKVSVVHQNGNFYAIYTNNSDSNIKMREVAAPNQDQPAPIGLTGVAPTSALNDGKITGTTTAMEYKLLSAENWTPATETEITGLAAGAYEVRFAAKPGFNVGVSADVVVPEYVAPVLTAVNLSVPAEEAMRYHINAVVTNASTGEPINGLEAEDFIIINSNLDRIVITDPLEANVQEGHYTLYPDQWVNCPVIGWDVRLPVGIYTLEFSRAGYVTTSVEFEITSEAVIVTESSIANGAENPTVVVSLSGNFFTEDAMIPLSWIIDTGTTGLSAESTIMKNTDYQVTIPLLGTAAAGTISIQASAAALSGNADSNTITVIVPEIVPEP